MRDDPIIPAEKCETMKEVRVGVDAMDAQLVALLTKRFSYMDAAARIKPTREAVRDEERKANVLANVRRMADQAGIPAGLTDRLWELLIEASIAHEFDEWDKRKN